jgi:hypothetical protein
MRSPLTGRYYIVTAVRKDGSAKTKYDCTEEVEALVAEENSRLNAEILRLREENRRIMGTAITPETSQEVKRLRTAGDALCVAAQRVLHQNYSFLSLEQAIAAWGTTAPRKVARRDRDDLPPQPNRFNA